MTKRARSPVLGYNHNLRYGGRTFHVQTEDSGQGYARLYTHLFFEGTILSSKKQEYDPEAHEDAVRALMQKLHKSMIKELTHREHDARIGAFFIARGEPAMLEDRSAAVIVEVSEPVAVSVAPEAAAAQLETPAVQPPREVVPAPARPKMTPKPVVVVQPAMLKRSPVQGTINPAATGNGPSPAPPTRPRAGAHYAVRDGSGFVTGNRVRASEAQPQPLASSRDIRMPWETPGPMRISQPIAAQPIADGPAVASSGKIRMPWDPPAPALPEAFAGDLVSDKSLDEVILEYLADDGEPEDR